MTEFISSLLMGEELILYPLIAGLLGSFAFGIIGSYVVVRRISYIAGAVSHTVLGGIGLSLYVTHHYGVAWFGTRAGSMLAALLAVVLIVLARKFGRNHEESLIGTVWVLGMAFGAILMTKTPAFNNSASYLFGSILFVTKSDLWQLGILNITILIMGALFYNKLLAVCFDEQFADLRGIAYHIYYLMLLAITAVTVVMMIEIIGLVMVIALLTLPAAAASVWSRHLWQMMIIASIICAISVFIGFAFSYVYELPSGAVIVVVSSIIYLCSLVLRRTIERISR